MLINQLVNGNIFVNGNSFFGVFKEVTLPEIKAIYEENMALGQNAKLELPTGLDLITAKVIMNAPYPNMQVLAGNPFRSHNFQFRGNLETYTGSERTAQNAYVCYMTATVKNNPLGNVKPRAKTEHDMDLNVTYCKLEVAGQTQPIIEVDVMNNIFKVDGVDILAEYRANLGI
jgi:P2 family phage contractile tail tube protein